MDGDIIKLIMNFTLPLPIETIYILYKLDQAGFDAYLVGGAVRDLVINAVQQLQTQKKTVRADLSSPPEQTGPGSSAQADHATSTRARQAATSGSEKNYLLHSKQMVTDFDFTTDATPEQIEQIFTESFYTNEFGTVGISYQHLWEQMQAEGWQKPSTTIASRLKQRQPDQDSLISLAQTSKVHRSLQDQLDQLAQKQKEKQLQPPPFEITTYRAEGVYRDCRRPEQVTWGSSLQQDLQRRDFTINALALSVKSGHLKKLAKKLPQEPQGQIVLEAPHYQLHDFHQGLKDLAQRLIRTVHSPDQRFSEDALRMLRAIRFSAQLDMKLEPLTLKAIDRHADLITKISWERIRDELLKMLTTKRPDQAIELLRQAGLLKHILPELLAAKGVEQGGHHTTDVWTHCLQAVRHCPSRDPIVRLATLLHDIGKPQTFKVREGDITFYNHEIVSSRLASRIGKRLKLSQEQQQRLFDLVRYHMFYYQPDHSDAAVRRLMKRVGLKNIDDILDLREGDRLGSGSRKTSWRLEELKQRMVEQLNQPFAVTDLAIDGNDLMQELGLKPGPKIGQVLEELMQAVLDNPELNQKDKLLSKARQILNKKA
jgi:putative nucleotidyltransferase with HDIG domain